MGSAPVQFAAQILGYAECKKSESAAGPAQGAARAVLTALRASRRRSGNSIDVAMLGGRGPRDWFPDAAIGAAGSGSWRSLSCTFLSTYPFTMSAMADSSIERNRKSG